MTLWFHPVCAAYRRPEPLLETLEGSDLPDKDLLERAARQSQEHRRLSRIDGAELSPTRQAVDSAQRQHEYYRCWQGLRRNFDPRAR